MAWDKYIKPPEIHLPQTYCTGLESLHITEHFDKLILMSSTDFVLQIIVEQNFDAVVWEDVKNM